MTTPRNKVFIYSPIDREGSSHRVLEEAGCELVLGQAAWGSYAHGDNEEELCSLAKGCDALMGTMIRSSPITKRVLQSSEKLRIVAKYTIGVDDIDVDAATELGILVTHAPTESNWGGVAESTMGVMLCLLKKLRERDEQVKDGGWTDDSLRGIYLGSRAEDGYAGLTVGIIGLGRVGGRFADLLRPWNMRIIACDPYIPQSQFDAHIAEAVDLPTLLSESDVVSLHVVLTKETRHMIGAAELSLMKPSAILVNTSRGPVVDEQALATALREETIASAALDVFEEEPLPEESPVRLLGNKVLLSPHMTSRNLGNPLGLGIEWATRSVLQALQGEVPDNIYNKEVITKWLERISRLHPAPS